MKIIRSTSLDPYVNLASEELLLEGEDDVFMIWRNGASVIIGKNQNAWTEVDTSFTEPRGIPVVRRLTGGGAVFHDSGNVNFTFITDASEKSEIDFTPFTMPIINALGEMGVSASADGRNDIISQGRKISGNAQCIYRCADGRRRLLHHGTLLYDADLTSLAGALRVNREKLRSKGIRSVSSRVGNLREIGGLLMTASEFAERLTEYAERLYGCAACGFTSDEMRRIEELAVSKYASWQWNFGNSPEYGNTVTERFPWGTVTADFTVDRGAFSSFRITGDFFGTETTELLERALIGCDFRRDAVWTVLEGVPAEKIFSGAVREDIIKLIFKEN